ncbi:hypothetical protein BKA67DRAFT_663379 [Truncatella angustata]|uniref:Zinc finger PHD-type domain-containing protein n=1 Tax=Truncatella angustata TaxID=152316 RepID=A0A9P8RMP2_9PEZI|nr:uncharacterized protein BKA67DRAFT_663379 [Truncatella angustata]KAH6647023.1 hypothetical protein BKA67DRAFT_663379 [Truncatella angustata]KAH8200095.1 hypothetical protein TruAng_005763 [Truncatella angustata]
MADTSARRSSRARTTQPPQLPSAPSSVTGRTERPSRAHAKAGSPQKSTGSGSLSSEPPEDSTATTASSDDNPHLRRRSTRNRDDDREKETKQDMHEMAIVSDENEIQEDDEAVRCVCGFDDYPGLPPLDEDTKKLALKDAIDIEQIFSIELTDDLAGFFVQCDVCKVWEHGLCMGIVNEYLLPDDYYCELCRKDLHKTYAASNGQKYSIYLPLHRPSRATSRATSATKEGAHSPKASDRKSSRAAAAAAAASMAKRRSTMNSRDAAYDEEQLRKAIEISKEEETNPDDEDDEDAQPRRLKRGRDDDDEEPEIKRQRTNSRSPSPGDEAIDSKEGSEDESVGRNGKKSSRNIARSQREKTEREERREEQERKRQEAANKRQGRAARRRADESDPSEETPVTSRTAVSRMVNADLTHPPDPPPSSQPVPDTPPADQVPASTNKKKTGVHPKKKGRNQYTKDRDNHLNDDMPARSMSRDIARDKDETHPKSNHEGVPKHHRSKGALNSRITMTDLKRRANNLMEFITRTQVELANDPLSERNSPRQPASEDGQAQSPALRPNGSIGKVLAERAVAATNGAATPPIKDTKDFRDMNCVEMMDALTRDLVKWQQEFAA